MKLETVTITGADDSTDIVELAELSEEFPFVEWGILISKSQEGGFRFPSRKWIDALRQIAQARKLNVATHMCGRWVRDLLIGKVDWNFLPACIVVSQRVQINIHKPFLVSARALSQRLLEQEGKRFIFQSDGVSTISQMGCTPAMFQWRRCSILQAAQACCPARGQLSGPSFLAVSPAASGQTMSSFNSTRSIRSARTTFRPGSIWKRGCACRTIARSTW